MPCSICKRPGHNKRTCQGIQEERQEQIQEERQEQIQEERQEERQEIQEKETALMAYYRTLHRAGIVYPFGIVYPLLGAFVEKIEARTAPQLGVPSIV